MTNKCCTAMVILLFIFISQHVQAESELIIGPAIVVAPDYMGSDDYDAEFFPVIQFAWESDKYTLQNDGNNQVTVGLFGAEIGTMDGIFAEVGRIKINNHSISSSIGVGYQGGRDEKDNDAGDLKGLGDIDSYLTGNVQLSYRPIDKQEVMFWSGDLEFGRDIEGETKSAFLKGRILCNHIIKEALLISHGPNMTWTNDDHMQAYFGITESQEQRSSYSRHNVDSGLRDVGYSFDVKGVLIANMAWAAGVDYSRLLGDAADSPLVDQRGDKNQYLTYLGIVYSF